MDAKARGASKFVCLLCGGLLALALGGRAGAPLSPMAGGAAPRAHAAGIGKELDPPPNLETSTKESDADGPVRAGDLVVYTVALRNTGNGDAEAEVTDALGDYFSVHDAGDFQQSAPRTLYWQGTVPSDGTVELHFTARVEGLADPPIGCTPLDNRVEIDDGFHDPFWVADPSPPCQPVWGIYLPAVLRAYRVFVDPYEPNDSPGQAYGPLISGQAYTAYFPTEADLDDFYYIEPSTASDVAISVVVPPALDIDLWVYDQDLNLIGGSARDGYGVDEEFGFTPQEPQRYYLRLYRYAGASMEESYALTATFDAR